MTLTELSKVYNRHLGLYRDGNFINNYSPSDDLLMTATYGPYIVTKIWPSQVMTMDGVQFKLNVDITAPGKHEIITKLNEISKCEVSEEWLNTINEAVKYIKDH